MIESDNAGSGEKRVEGKTSIPRERNSVHLQSVGHRRKKKVFKRPSGKHDLALGGKGKIAQYAEWVMK